LHEASADHAGDSGSVAARYLEDASGDCGPAGEAGVAAAVHEASADPAGDPGSVAARYLEDASGYRGHADEAGVVAAMREDSADHAGDSGSVAARYLEDASGYRGHADQAGVVAAVREDSADHAGDPGNVAARYLEDASGYRGPVDEAGVVAAVREDSADPAGDPGSVAARYLEDASGYRGPVDEAGVVAAMREAFAYHAGDPGNVAGRYLEDASGYRGHADQAGVAAAMREASADPAGDSGSVAARYLEDASGYRGHADEAGVAAAAREAFADHAGDPGNVAGRYLEDASGYHGHADRLLVPTDEAGVVAALREATTAGVPVTIAGGGTGVTGGGVPMGGWVLSMEKLNGLRIHPGYAIAGAGVPLRDLQASTQRAGQFYPPDPTENSAFLGGTIATNASGSRSFRFGSTRRWVQGLRVVLADGRLLDLARGEAIDFDPGTIPLPAVTKNTAGYLLRPGMDWIDLFVGSEGTLGVITEARVGLLPAPAAILAGVVFFAEDSAALDAVDVWRSTEARMLEYLDRASLELLRARFPEIPHNAQAAILFDQALTSEDDPEVDHWLDRIQAAGAFEEESWFAMSAADRERFRHFRHSLPELVNDAVRRAGALKMNTDYAVPLARNREMLAVYRRRLEQEFPGRYVIFGHIGDAHVHVNIFSDPANPAPAAGLLREFAREAVALGGTVSAEHGLGKRKSHLLELQYSAADIGRMRAVKHRLDPGNILGRGTLLS
jgi:FAD/FMN-containing dehydrogenase